MTDHPHLIELDKEEVAEGEEDASRIAVDPLRILTWETKAALLEYSDCSGTASLRWKNAIQGENLLKGALDFQQCNGLSLYKFSWKGMIGECLERGSIYLPTEVLWTCSLYKRACEDQNRSIHRIHLTFPDNKDGLVNLVLSIPDGGDHDLEKMANEISTALGSHNASLLKRSKYLKRQSNIHN